MTNAACYVMLAAVLVFGCQDIIVPPLPIESSYLPKSIKIIAGTSSVAGFSGDGGLATSAQLSGPEGVAVGHDGALYVADTQNHRIRKVGLDGRIQTIAGTGNEGYSGDRGPATHAALSWPMQLAIDQGGNVLVADFGNNRIRQIDSEGTITTIAGNGPSVRGFPTADFEYEGEGGAALAARFTPSDLAIDREGVLYVADGSHHRLLKIGRDGIISTVAGSGDLGCTGDGVLATSATFSSPSGIAFDAENNLWVADPGCHQILKVDQDGIVTTIAGSALFPARDSGIVPRHVSPSDLASDTSGYLYYGDPDKQRVRRIDRNGQITTVIENRKYVGEDGRESFLLGEVFGIAFGPSGELYVANSDLSTILKVIL